jgi:hypothetical protein
MVCSVFAKPVELVGCKDLRKSAPAINDRHRFWIKKRASDTGHRDGWRPQKRFRVSVTKWLARLDNQVRTSTSWSGLMTIQYNPLKTPWIDANWKSWPHLQTCEDQGGDGVSAVHALEYFLQCNHDAVYDWCHGCRRDAQLGLQKMGKWPLVLLLMVIHNLGHGPERDECLRFAQMQECMDVLFKVFDAGTCELFQARAATMLDEMAAQIDLSDGESPVAALWQHLKANCRFQKLGHRVRMCDFFGFNKANRSLLNHWTEIQFKSEVLALELDFLTGRAVKDKVILKANVFETEKEVTTTSSSVTQVDTKLLRGCQQNAVVITCMTLGIPWYKRVTAAMTHVIGRVEKFSGASAKACRSVSGNQSFLKDIFGGGFASHIGGIWGSLSDPIAMRECGFLEFHRHDNDDLQALRAADQDLADFMGGLTMQTMANRCRRLYYLVNGWPGQFLRLLFANHRAVSSVLHRLAAT